MLLNSELLWLFYASSPKAIFQYVIPFTLNHYVYIKTLSSFIYIYNNNNKITTKYDTHPNKKYLVIFFVNPVEKEDVIFPVHQVHIQKEIEYQKRKIKWYAQ